VTKQGSADVDGQSAVDQLGSEQTSVQSIAGLRPGDQLRWVSGVGSSGGGGAVTGQARNGADGFG
jgi:hypothetical protein